MRAALPLSHFSARIICRVLRVAYLEEQVNGRMAAHSESWSSPHYSIHFKALQRRVSERELTTPLCGKGHIMRNWVPHSRR